MMTKASIGLAAAVLAVGFLASAKAQQAASPDKPEPGTSEFTDAAHGKLFDAVKEADAVFKGGSQAQRDEVAKKVADAHEAFEKAVEMEAEKTREVREGKEWVEHYVRASQRTAQGDASEQLKAKKDVDDAEKRLSKALGKAKQNVRKRYPELDADKYFEYLLDESDLDVTRSDYYYLEKREKERKQAEKEKNQKQRKKEEKESSSGNTSGPTGLFGGDVSIGIGVGGGHREGYCGSRKSHEKKKGTKKGGCVPSGSKPPENKSSVPHGCGCGPH